MKSNSLLLIIGISVFSAHWLPAPADPSNSWGGAARGDRPPESAFGSKIYLNTGTHGARENHWLHLTFTGLKGAELIGARVELTADSRKQYRWIHSNHSYKSGGSLDAHFGLGQATSADITVTLLNARKETIDAVAADRSHALRFGDQP